MFLSDFLESCKSKKYTFFYPMPLCNRQRENIFLAVKSTFLLYFEKKRKILFHSPFLLWKGCVEISKTILWKEKVWSQENRKTKFHLLERWKRPKRQEGPVNLLLNKLKVKILVFQETNQSPNKCRACQLIFFLSKDLLVFSFINFYSSSKFTLILILERKY